MAILVISVFWLMGVGFIQSFLITPECIDNEICTDSEMVHLTWSSLVLMSGFLIIVALGILCKLPGAYYKPDANPLPES